MTDFVGTCPKDFWMEWLREGDVAGTEESGQEYYWRTRHPLAEQVHPGDRLYIVANGKLRGYAPIVSVQFDPQKRTWWLVRKGGAVACTVDEYIRGFQGLRKRWWLRSREKPFENWMTP